MKPGFCFQTFAACGLISFGTGASAQLVSTFDTGLDGWTGTGGAVSFVATGGNPGGFLREADRVNGFMVVNAPSRFLGDLSTFYGGTLSFDAKNISNSPSDLPSPGPWFGTVTITSASGSVSEAIAGTSAGNPVADGQWHTYSTTLNADSWGAGLAPVLGNVTGISVQLEFNDNIVETAGFDNFRVSSVPEASTGAYLGLAFAALIYVRVRAARRTRSSPLQPDHATLL